MNEQQRAMLDQQMRLQRGAAIIEGTQSKFRQDGYTNLLNRYGTAQDNSMAYQYRQELITDDLELIRLYEGNGLFAKIIDRPSEEAVKHGLDIDYGDEDISEYIEDRLDALEFEDKFATAEKWARLYGGSIIVMLVDDGRGLEEPLNWEDVRSIDELRVFERAIVQPDYSSLYNFHFFDTMETGTPFAEPEYYQVFSLYGYFTVHRSRCLVFRNGRLPEQTTNAIYRYWGIPEYVKIKRALRECITSHEDGVKLLERSVQAIYKMRNLANMLSTSDGEDKVLQRLQVIDMARGILNSIAIDNDGEDYDFKTLQMSGVKDILDATCNMLSAVTNIPQTILFGRSPAGMNSTGENDMENYYNMVENIQKQNMKKNIRTVIDLLLKQGRLEGKIPVIPKYKVKFAALWSMSDTEKADVDNKKANTDYTKAQTAQVYIDSGVVDPSEVRKSLADEGGMEIEEMLSDKENELNLPSDTFDVGNPAKETIRISGVEADRDGSEGAQEVIRISGPEGEADGDGRVIRILTGGDREEDGADFPAAAVIIIKDGKILCASRRNNEGVCGPGGHAEEGETPEEAAVREAMEEFNIVPLNILPVGEYKGSTGLYLPSMVYFTDQFSGTPEADGDEMLDARWLSLEELRKEKLFPPFKESLDMLVELLSGNNLTTSNFIGTLTLDGGSGSGNWGHAGRPGKVGGSAKGGGKVYRTGTKQSGFSSEAKKRVAEKKAGKNSGGAGANNSGSGNSTKNRKPVQEAKRFVSNAETHKKLVEECAYIGFIHKRPLNQSIDEAIASGDKMQMGYVAADLSKGDKDECNRYKQAFKDGTLEQYLKEAKLRYVDRTVAFYEEKAEEDRSEKKRRQYESNITKCSDVEAEIHAKVDGKVFTAKEYYDMVYEKAQTLTSEEKQLEISYYSNNKSDLGIDYRSFNAKMYGNSGEKLSTQEQRLVDMITNKAQTLPSGYSLYRSTNEQYLEALVGMKATDSNFENALKALEGKEIEHKAMTSCGVGIPTTIHSVGVVCKIRTGDNSKGYVMQNTNEGEIILPPGTKLKVKKISKGTKEYPVWRGLDPEDPYAFGYGSIKQNGNCIYIEMEAL